MTKADEKATAKKCATRYLVAGLVLAGVGYLPLQLYILFGPRDGNPIGLGLLAIVAIPAGFIVCAIGMIKLVIGCFSNGKR